MSDGTVWLYIRDGHVVHALTTGMLGRANVSVCGVTPHYWARGVLYYRSWLGTGEQREYERAAALPRCKRCVKLLTPTSRGRSATP